VLAEKNLLLDLGDTLVRIKEPFDSYTRRAISSVLKECNMSDNEYAVEAFLTIRNEIRSAAHESLKETPIAAFLAQGISQICGQSLDKEKLKYLELKYIQEELNITDIFPDTLMFLKQAKTMGRELYIVTNNFSSAHVEQLLDKFNLSSYMSGIYVSATCGYRKPHMEFLNGFFHTFNLDSSYSVIIGDKYEMDVLSGKSIGIKTCLLNRRNEQVDMTSGPPDYSFNSLSEIEFSKT